jgi:hypothetical protein
MIVISGVLLCGKVFENKELRNYLFLCVMKKVENGENYITRNVLICTVQGSQIKYVVMVWKCGYVEKNKKCVENVNMETCGNVVTQKSEKAVEDNIKTYHRDWF